MSSELTPRIAVLSALYFIIALVLIAILDFGLYYFINEIVFTILNWFNRQHWIIKILILFFGGFSVFWAFLTMSQRISTMLGGIIFDHLPHNGFTLISTFLVSITNAILAIIALWRVPQTFDFWIVCELLLLSVFIWSLSAVVLPAKEQMKSYKNEA